GGPGRSAGGIARVRRPTSSIWPSLAWRITTRVASHASRRDVSAGTFPPSSRTDCPGCLGSARAAASTCTTTWYRSLPDPGSSPFASAVSATSARASACRWAADGGASAGPPPRAARALPCNRSRPRSPPPPPPQHRPHLRLQPPPYHNHPVLPRIDLQRPPLVSRPRLLGLQLPVHPPPPPDDLLHVRRRPGLADLQESLLRLRRRHPRQRPHLGVGQLPARQRRRQPWQPTERPGHPHPLPGRPRVQPRPPGQPVGARPAAVPPAAPGIELADQVEQPRGRGVQVSRELGDLFAEPIELDRRRRWGGRAQRGEQIHGEPPRSHPTTRFSTDLGACLVATFRTGMIFASTQATPGATGRRGA